MGRASIKQNKTEYQILREKLSLSREKASEMLETISADRIVKIESGKHTPYPDEVLRMADTYKTPHLLNFYCSKECPIGKEYVPEIKIKVLSQIVLEMLASLNSVQKQKERLIEITVDGQISNEEIADFVYIQEELERISVTIEALRLWAENMIATNAIDMKIYNEYISKKSQS